MVVVFEVVLGIECIVLVLGFGKIRSIEGFLIATVPKQNKPKVSRKKERGFTSSDVNVKCHRRTSWQ